MCKNFEIQANCQKNECSEMLVVQCTLFCCTLCTCELTLFQNYLNKSTMSYAKKCVKE